MKHELATTIILLFLAASLALSGIGCNLSPEMMSTINQSLQAATYYVSPDGYGLVIIGWYDGEQWVLQMLNNRLISAGRASTQTLSWTVQLLKQSGWRLTSLAAIPSAARAALTVGGSAAAGYGSLNAGVGIPMITITQMRRMITPVQVVQ